ncbi:U-box domain-containing protein [Xylaria acuta]|nr:U-box domain-containing protein [Xylaria acuta]
MRTVFARHRDREPQYSTSSSLIGPDPAARRPLVHLYYTILYDIVPFLANPATIGNQPHLPLFTVAMTSNAEKAARLKEEGNRHFGAGNFHAAEGLYSKASSWVADVELLSVSIIADAANPYLYTNRAMSRTKLALHEEAASDCYTSLKLSGPNMKAYFLLSQCLVALHDFNGALENALEAHKMGTETNDKSLPQLTTQVLRCKKERWDELEKRRSREGQELEKELIRLLEREHHANIADSASDIERAEILEEFANKITLLEATFEAARSASGKKREVPDWVIDDISFGIMVDPVITKTGKSYERASIMEALRRNPVDPLTREPLLPSDLRPNIGLRQACEEFLENNGWAVDW